MILSISHASIGCHPLNHPLHHRGSWGLSRPWTAIVHWPHLHLRKFVITSSSPSCTLAIVVFIVIVIVSMCCSLVTWCSLAPISAVKLFRSDQSECLNWEFPSLDRNFNRSSKWGEMGVSTNGDVRCNYESQWKMVDAFGLIFLCLSPSTRQMLTRDKAAELSTDSAFVHFITLLRIAVVVVVFRL